MATHSKSLLVAGGLVLLFGLTGCNSAIFETPPPPSAEVPISVDEAGYELFHTELAAQDVIVSCFEDGSGMRRVLSCFLGSQDIPDSELTDFDSLGYDLSYVDAGQGTTVACFEDGANKRRVMTCFPVDPK